MLPSKCASKAIRNLERPRPMKWMTESIPHPQPYTKTSEVGDEVLQDLEALVKHLTISNINHAYSNLIMKVCQELKLYGAALEAKNAVRLDRCFAVLRNVAGDERFDTICRLRVLEVIDLRSMGWKSSETFDSNYRYKVLHAEENGLAKVVPSSLTKPTPLAYKSTVPSVPSTMTSHISYCPINNNSTNPFMLISNPTPLPTTVSVLGPGEVLKSSGKYTKPTKIPAKNYFKDEVIIRNSDSGKVMGIKGRRVHMIEEMSGTVVSFQRVVQGAKDRLVQVTGPTEEAIGCAKGLIEETIRRNVSPIRDRRNPLQMSESATNLVSPLYRGDEFGSQAPALMHSLSMNDARIAEYQFTLAVGSDLLTLSGCSFNTVKIAKLVLEEYFAGDAKRTIYESDEEEQCKQPDTRRKQPTAPLHKERTGNGRHLSRSSSARTALHKYHVSESSSDSDDDTFIETKSSSKAFIEKRRSSKALDQHGKTTGKLLSKKITYDRSFLLDCAASPYSQSTPKDMPKIIQELSYIIKKTPDFFDPIPFKRHQLNTAVVSNATVTYWPFHMGSSGSQENEEYDPPLN